MNAEAFRGFDHISLVCPCTFACHLVASPCRNNRRKALALVGPLSTPFPIRPRDPQAGSWHILHDADPPPRGIPHGDRHHHGSSRVAWSSTEPPSRSQPMPKQETIGLRVKKQVLGLLGSMFASKSLQAIFSFQLPVYSGGWRAVKSSIRRFGCIVPIIHALRLQAGCG